MSRPVQHQCVHHAETTRHVRAAGSSFGAALAADVWRGGTVVARSVWSIVSWLGPIASLAVAGCLTVSPNDRSISLLPADQRFGGFDAAVVTARPTPTVPSAAAPNANGFRRNAPGLNSPGLNSPGLNSPGSDASGLAAPLEQSTTTVDSRIGRGGVTAPDKNAASNPSGAGLGSNSPERSTEALRANPPLGRRLPRRDVPVKPRGKSPAESANDPATSDPTSDDSPTGDSRSDDGGPSNSPNRNNGPNRVNGPDRANVPAENAPGGNKPGSDERVAELTPPRVELDDIEVASPLSLQVEAPTNSQINGFTTYQITIRNVDAAAVSDVVVRCEFESGLTCPGKTGQWVERRIAAMPVGDVQTFPLTLQADRVGRLCCGFRVSGVSGDQPFELPAVERCVDFQPRKIEVAVTGPEQRTVGSQAQYTLLIRNLTDQKFEKVLVRLNHDVAISVREAPGANSQSTTGVEWKLETLQPRQEILLPVEFECLSPANRACFSTDVSGDSLAHETVEACLQIVPVPGLLDVRVRDASDPLEVGRKGRYEITVRNIGLQSVQSIVLNVSLTNEVNITSTGVDLGKELLPLECQLSDDSRTASFDAVETLQPDQQLVYVISVQGLRKGTAELTAKVTSSLSKTPVQVVEPTNVVDPNDDQARF